MTQKFWRSFQTIIDASCDAINQHFLTIAQKLNAIADLPSSSCIQFVVQYIQGLDVHKAVGI